MRLILGLGAAGLGGGGLPDGSAISRLFTICGVVMMKITRSTKTKSSNGEMFNSFDAPCPRCDVFFILFKAQPAPNHPRQNAPAPGPEIWRVGRGPRSCSGP